MPVIDPGAMNSLSPEQIAQLARALGNTETGALKAAGFLNPLPGSGGIGGLPMNPLPGAGSFGQIPGAGGVGAGVGFGTGVGAGGPVIPPPSFSSNAAPAPGADFASPDLAGILNNMGASGGAGGFAPDAGASGFASGAGGLGGGRGGVNIGHPNHDANYSGFGDNTGGTRAGQGNGRGRNPPDRFTVERVAKMIASQILKTYDALMRQQGRRAAADAPVREQMEIGAKALQRQNVQISPQAYFSLYRAKVATIRQDIQNGRGGYQIVQDMANRIQAPVGAMLNSGAVKLTSEF